MDMEALPVLLASVQTMGGRGNKRWTARLLGGHVHGLGGVVHVPGAWDVWT